jgi:hypothetical protein
MKSRPYSYYTRRPKLRVKGWPFLALKVVSFGLNSIGPHILPGNVPFFAYVLVATMPDEIMKRHNLFRS